MNKKLYLPLSLIFLFFSCRNLVAQIPQLPDDANFFDYIQSYNNSDSYDPNENEEGGANAQHNRLIQQWGDRLYPHGNFSVANKALIDYARYYHPSKLEQ
jgi:hypothetical protein